MGEDEGGAGDGADLAGAGGDVLQGAPSAGEQGEPSFSQAAQGTLDGVPGTGIDIKLLAAGCLFDGNQDRDARAVVAGVGQGGQGSSGGPVEGGQGVGVDDLAFDAWATLRAITVRAGCGYWAAPRLSARRTGWPA